MTEQADDSFGPISTLDNIPQVAEDILSMLSQLLIDYNPRIEENQHAVFAYAATIFDEETDDEEEQAEGADESDLSPVGSPFPQCEIEISYGDAERIADILVSSRLRPDTQIIGPTHLEMLIRDETTHSFALPPVGMKLVNEFKVDGKQFTATVDVPTVELLIRCAIRREGLERLRVFDSEKLYRALGDSEVLKTLTDRTRDRISALSLLRFMARSGILSVCITSESGITAEELEKLATAYRVRMAYEADIAYAPVLDVNRLDGTPRQPIIIRQRSARTHELVEAIGKGEKPGFMGDRLLGAPALIDEELSLRYLRAVGDREPFSAFMGYYHVLEYGMNETWFTDLRERVEKSGAILARPAGDVRMAAIQAAQLLGVRTEDVRYTELRAVNAVMRRLDIDIFARDLRDNLPGAIEYFAQGELPFVEVEHIDFATSSAGAARTDIADKLARRIYTVRNAITHSKASAKRYSPYTDDLHLMREVPLVRIAAEQLIIPSSERI